MTVAGVAAAALASVLLTTFVVAALRGAWLNWTARVCVLVASLAIASFAVATYRSGAPHLGDVRVSVTAVELSLLATPFGGDPETDAIVVAPRQAGDAGVHTRALTIRPATGGADLVVRRPGIDEAAGLMQWKLHDADDDAWARQGSTVLEVGQAVCVPMSEGVVAVRLGPRHELTIAGQSSAPLPFASSSRRALRLSHAAAVTAEDVAAGPIAGARTLVARRGGGLFGAARVHVDLLDRGAFVGDASCERRLSPTSAPPPRLQRGGPEIDIQFLGVRLAEDWRAAASLREGRRLPESALVAYRPLTVGLVAADEATRLRVAFARPEIHVLDAAALEASLPPGREGRVRLVFGGPGAGDGGEDVVVVRPASVGSAAMGALGSRLEFGRDPGFRIAGPGLNSEVDDFGRRGFLNEPEDPRAPRAEVRVDRVDADWGPLRNLTLLLTAGLLASLAGTWRLRVRSPPAFIILSLADFLLIMRVLVAAQGAVSESSVVAAGHVAAGVLALACVPAVLAGAHWATTTAGQTPLRALTACQAVFLVVVGVHLQTVNGGVAWTPLLVLGTSAAIALASLCLPSGWAVSARGGLVASAKAGRTALAASRMGGLLDAAGAILSKPWAAVAVAAAVLILARLLVPASAGINTAAIYTPLVVAFWAYVLSRAQKAVDARRSAGSAGRMFSLGIWIAAGTACAAVVGAALRHDGGYVIVHSFVFGLILLVMLSWRPTGSGDAASRVALCVGVAAIALAFAGTMRMELGGPETWPDPAAVSDEAEARAIRDRILLRATGEDTDWLRLRGVQDEEGLADLGTREAEGLRAAMHAWREYADQGPWGRGYMNLPEPTELRRYHLSDNLAAVHLLAPFGRVGALAFLLILVGAAATATLRLHRDRGARWPGWGDAAGIFSLWSLAGASAYMVLANLDVLPFTGRNVVMLSALSPSDLIEGCLLLAIALCTLGTKR